jgi:plastocyanin
MEISIVCPPAFSLQLGLENGDKTIQVSRYDNPVKALADFEPNFYVGSTVIWTNDDFGIHTVTDNNGAFESDSLRPDDTFEYTFDNVGTYDYHCLLHPTMVAQVVVQ